MIKVLPSSNPCPEKDLLNYVKELESLDVEYLHCDVMDGDFVDNKCLDFSTIEEVRNNTNILLDVHLMVYNSFRNVKKFAELKPSIITIHYESLKNLKEFNKIHKFLKKKQILMGLAINPNTPVEIVSRLIQNVDLVLIMTVVPGKSGQTLITDCLEKISEVKKITDNQDVLIEVDGGINEENSQEIIKLGADFLVMGSAFYKSKNKSALLNEIDKHYKK